MSKTTIANHFPRALVRSANVLLVALGAAAGCSDAPPDVTVTLDAATDLGAPTDTAAPSDARDATTADAADIGAAPRDAAADVTRDAGADVAADTPVDAARDAVTDAPLDAGGVADATADAHADATNDAPGDAVSDVVGTDGGYAVGATTADMLAIHGGITPTVIATNVSECAAGEVAVGIAVQVGGRSFVQDARLQCAALDATGRAFGAAHWAGGDPASDWNTASCGAGQHVTGLLGVSGDILDRLGARCAPLGWTASSTQTPLGPWGGTTGERSVPCTPSAGVSRLALQQVTYFGGTTGWGVDALCRQITAR